MALSIIIPSRNVDNLTACLLAVREHEPNPRIIVIDDGLEWGDARWAYPDARWANPMEIVTGIRPFVFSRAINQGIAAASTDDLLLLNDDCLLKTPRGFSIMQTQWRANQQYGLIASSIDDCGTPEQIRRGTEGLRELSVMAVYACVFLPRSTIDLVGMLDERYSLPGGYGVEDADHSKSIRKAGLKLAVSDSCLVTHTELPSTFRHRDRKPGEPKTSDVRLHERLYREKWGEQPYV